MSVNSQWDKSAQSAGKRGVFAIAATQATPLPPFAAAKPFALAGNVGAHVNADGRAHADRTAGALLVAMEPAAIVKEGAHVAAMHVDDGGGGAKALNRQRCGMALSKT